MSIPGPSKIFTESRHSSSREASQEDVLRVLVTDDSPMYRRLISETFSRYTDVEVIGTAYDGEDCLELVQKFDPNVITLDINMPRRDGLSTLEELRRRGNRAYVVMVSTPTAQSADQTLHALRKGALDMILKPMGSHLSANRKALDDQLAKQVETIRSLLQAAKTRRLRSVSPRSTDISHVTVAKPVRPNFGHTPSPASRAIAKTNPPATRLPVNVGAFDALCIGVSTGGPSALGTLLPQLPSRIPVPIFIVQHMPPLFTKSLADHLNSQCKFRICEATDGQIVEPGVGYIAPGGKQMRIAKHATQVAIEITDDSFVAAAKPSVDYLFNSVAEIYGKKTLAMIMTGMGSDGLNGCRKLFSKGARILAQSEESCVVYGMPRQVIENQVASEVVSLPSMANRVIELLRLSK